MNFKIDGDKIIFELVKKIDTGNAAQIEKKIFSAIEKNNATEIILDAENLEYISSIGLRIILKLNKLHPKKVKIINVSPDVAEIFRTTGFDRIISIEHALRKISIDGCQCLGKGNNGSVYRLDEDKIVKVYHNKKISADVVKLERNNSQTAFLNGIPTAIVYDVVDVEGSLGIVYELIDATTVNKFIAENPERLEEVITKIATLIKEVHKIELEPGVFPYIEKVFRKRTDELKNFLTCEEIAFIHKGFDLLPQKNTYIHGDCHLGNFMLQNDEVLFCDMANSSLGNPMYDIMSLYMYNLGLVKFFPEYISDFYAGWKIEKIYEVWDVFKKVYFETDDKNELAEIDEMMEFYNYMRWLTYLNRIPAPNNLKIRFVEKAREEFFPKGIKNFSALKRL